MNQCQIICLLQDEIYDIVGVEVDSVTENLLSDRLAIDLVSFLYIFTDFENLTGIPVHNIFKTLNANEFTLEKISNSILEVQG